MNIEDRFETVIDSMLACLADDELESYMKDAKYRAASEDARHYTNLLRHELYALKGRIAYERQVKWGVKQ